MKYCYILFLLVCFCCFGDVTDIHLNVNPVVEHEYGIAYYRDNEPYVSDQIRIPIPEFSLQSGDVLKMNTIFNDNKGVQINNSQYIIFEIRLITGTLFPEDAWPISNCNGSALISITEQNGYRITSRSDTTVYQYNEHYFELHGTIGFLNGISVDEYGNPYNDFTDGAIFRSFTMEWSLPTEIDLSVISPVVYSGSIVIYTALYDAPYDMNLLSVVPEPASLVLLGIGGLLIGRKTKVVK